MDCIDQLLLDRRFKLQKTQYISERFAKSPNITEKCFVSDHLLICHAVQDDSILPLIRESFLRAYRYVKDWFGYQRDIAFALWMAPELIDLQYMTCLSCDENFFCAPGSQNGIKIILFLSPLSCQKNASPNSLTATLSHEIAHHIIREISGASNLTMKRKESADLPMWLEEGLCQLVQGELNPDFQKYCNENIRRSTNWYSMEELWKDLSSCQDVGKAYLQAYKETKSFVRARGKTEVIQLLHSNRTHDVNWNDLPH